MPRSRSSMLVLARDLVSTRLTITARYRLYFPSAEGRLPDASTDPAHYSLIGAGGRLEALQVQCGPCLPAFLAVLGHHGGEYTAAHVELRVQAHETRPRGADQVVEDTVGDRFVERPLIAIGPDVELEAFQF